jgi:hypothetical protein
LGPTVKIETVSDKGFKNAWKDKVKRRADALEKTLLKFAPELIRDKLTDYYGSLGQSIPTRLRVIDQNTKLSEEERDAIFSVIKQLWVNKADKEAIMLEGFYSSIEKKIVLEDSSANVAVLAHEMAHAYADQGWNELMTMMTLRKMEDTNRLDEGMATLIERIVVDEWVKKQPDKNLKAPPAAYDKSYTDKAEEFIKLAGRKTAYECYFAGEVDFTDKNKPEDSLVLGKQKKKWKWKWR